MNLFVLDADPRRAAEMQCDKHICKQSIEYAQLLSAAHHVWNSPHRDSLYKLTHKNHPATKWVAAHPEHYQWTYALACATWDEYTHRYGKTHGSARLRDLLADAPTMVGCGRAVPPPQCMPDTCKVAGDTWDAVVAAYQQYYRDAKAAFATWKNRDIPAWFSVV
jgi:hypothetical protein